MTYTDYEITKPLDSRGRNGWFKPHDVTVGHFPAREYGAGLDNQPARVYLDVNSKQRGSMSPIVLTLSVEDALAIARLLIEHAEAVGREATCPMPTS